MPILAFAASEQISKDRKITQITAYKDLVFVTFMPGFVHSQGCPSGGTKTLAIDMTNDVGKEIYSAALAAAAAGKNVGFGISGCHSDRPRVYRIDVAY